jgi:cytochrome c oxidase subunit II
MKARAAACALLLSSCGSMDWMADPSSPNSRSIATLTWVASIGIAVMVLIVWGILVYLVARRERGTLAEHMPHTTQTGMRWIYVWGLAVPGVLFTAALIASVVMMFSASEHQHAHKQPDIIVTGHQWWWEVRYNGQTPDETFTTANEIHIPVGRPVVIGLRSADVIHSFWVPKLQGKVDLVPARENTIQIEADVPGRYDGQCAEFCGEEHAMMRIVVIAQNETDYAAWKIAQHGPSILPTREPEIHGLEVFEQRSCGLCHTIRGTHALGTVGPDLTHLGSRQMIAANSYPNDRAHLQAWITKPHALKPQVLMPNLFQMTGEDINALATYLRSLQ